jgi:copper chaperone CopZ
MSTETYTVVGMTCDHCARSVTEEVDAIDGVTLVEVDLTTGALAVTADRVVGRESVRSAVQEAGYALAE